jgi:hypothetical protein
MLFGASFISIAKPATNWLLALLIIATSSVFPFVES